MHGTGGPNHCAPLLYVCFSCHAQGKDKRAGGLLETARLLLRLGAGQSATIVTEDAPGIPLSCLYAASRLNNNVALTRLRLEAGAHPNDGESVYHTTEHADLECLRLLLAQGAAVHGANALKHMLDREDMEGPRLPLAAWADPDISNDRGETALHWACWRGFGNRARLPLEHGASLTEEDSQFHGTPASWFGHGSKFCDAGDGDYPETA